MMLLDDKVAVIYGAAGAIGGAVARAMAREGARVFLTGRSLDSVERVARDIRAAGGLAEAAQVDAVDERAVHAHLDAVLAAAGQLDVSFNAVGLTGDRLLGVPLVDQDLEQFLRPITTYARSFLITARQAATRMIPRRSGVLMTVSALPARKGTQLNGGYGAAMAAKEALTRDLSTELAPHGLRAVCLRPHGMPETRVMREVFESKPLHGTWEQFQTLLAGMTHPRRTLKLDELAEVAAFMASPRAGAMTGTTVNLTMGSLDD